MYKNSASIGPILLKGTSQRDTPIYQLQCLQSGHIGRLHVPTTHPKGSFSLPYNSICIISMTTKRMRFFPEDVFQFIVSHQMKSPLGRPIVTCYKCDFLCHYTFVMMLSFMQDYFSVYNGIDRGQCEGHSKFLYNTFQIINHMHLAY